MSNWSSARKKNPVAGKSRSIRHGAADEGSSTTHRNGATQASAPAGWYMRAHAATRPNASFASRPAAPRRAPDTRFVSRSHATAAAGSTDATPQTMDVESSDNGMAKTVANLSGLRRTPSRSAYGVVPSRIVMPITRAALPENAMAATPARPIARGSANAGRQAVRQHAADANDTRSA